MPGPNVSTEGIDLTGRLSPYGAGVGWMDIPFPVALAGLTGTNKVCDNFTFGFYGRVMGVYYVSTVPASTAARTLTLTPSLGGTNVTGGVLVLTTANCTAGAKVAGTAVTAANSFGPTTVFDLTLSSVTAFAEGSGVVMVSIYNDDLRNALWGRRNGLAS